MSPSELTLSIAKCFGALSELQLKWPWPKLDLSGIGLPDFEFPSISIPSFSLPSFSLPNLVLPNLVIPEFDLSRLRLPSITLPSITLPSIPLPSLDLPSIPLTDKGKPAIDFQTSFPAANGNPIGYIGYEVGDFLLDFNGDRRTRLIINQIDLTVADVLDLSGAVAFEFGPTYTVNIATGLPAKLGPAANLVQPILNELTTEAGLTLGPNLSTINGLEVETMTIGASNLNGFLGFGDPDFSSNLATQDLTGFSFQNVNLSLAILKPTLPIKKLPKFTALKATIGSLTTLGMSDVLQLQGQGIKLNVNSGSEWPGGFGPAVINFEQSFPGGFGTAGFKLKPAANRFIWITKPNGSASALKKRRCKRSRLFT